MSFPSILDATYTWPLYIMSVQLSTRSSKVVNGYNNMYLLCDVGIEDMLHQVGENTVSTICDQVEICHNTVSHVHVTPIIIL